MFRFHRLNLISWIWLIQISTIINGNDEFKCPNNQFFLYPCRCLSGGFNGVNLSCNDSNLATISLALENLKLPINQLTIINCNITRLFGPLFKDKVVLSLNIIDSKLQRIDSECLNNLNVNLKSMSLNANNFMGISNAVGVDLTNLTKLSVINNPALVEIKNNDFKKNANLIELNLFNNSIAKIETSALSPLLLLGKYDIMFLFDDNL